jgi:NTF2-like protein (DUF6841)
VTTDHDAIVAEVRAWFDGYLQTFARLARGESSDLNTVADLCSTPTTFVTDDSSVTAADREALVRVLGGQVEQLRRMGHARIDIHRLDVRALNARAALIEGTVSRYDRDGREYARLGGAYLEGRPRKGPVAGW